MPSILHLARSASRLTSAERRHALAALGWMLTVSVALRCAGYARVRAFAGALSPARSSRPVNAAECARAIDRAARLLPRAGCLTRALAAECLLTRAGLPSVFRIGVRRRVGERLQAHAWIESDGVDVAGRAESADFQPLRGGGLP